MSIKLKDHNIKGLKDEHEVEVIAIISARGTLFPEKVAKANDMLSRTIFMKDTNKPGIINMNRDNLTDTPN